MLVEGVVIVGSILLAFGIDAWWDERQGGERRDALLRGLASDFEVAASDLDRVAGFHQRVLDASERLLVLTHNGQPSVSLQPQVDSLLTELLLTATYDPPTGTLDALISSGDLEIIDSPELVLSLTRWPALAADLTEDEDLAMEHYWSALMPYLRERVRVTDLVRANEWETWQLPRDHGLTDAYRLLDDLRFENLVYERRNTYKTIVQDAAPPVGEEIVRIRDLIAAAR